MVLPPCAMGGMDLILFILLGIHWVSWICALVTFINLVTFSAILSSNVISVAFSHFAFWDSSCTYVGPSHCRLFTDISFILYFLSFCPCMLLSVYFLLVYILIHSFFSSALYDMLVYLPTKFFSSLVLFFTSRVSVWFFITFKFSATILNLDFYLLKGSRHRYFNFWLW